MVQMNNIKCITLLFFSPLGPSIFTINQLNTLIIGFVAGLVDESTLNILLIHNIKMLGMDGDSTCLPVISENFRAYGCEGKLD